MENIKPGFIYLLAGEAKFLIAVFVACVYVHGKLEIGNAF